MRRIAVWFLIGVLAVTSLPLAAQAKVDREPGGMKAFFVGCCWGLREGLEWNEGAGMHWREWCSVVPVLGTVLGVWAGIECAKGMTAHEWSQKNSANWY